MFDKDYLIDIDVEITSLKHKIAEKTLISYNSYSKEAKQTFDELNTVYYLLKNQFNEIDSAIMKKYMNTMDYKLAKYAAITKIMRSTNVLLSELILNMATSNKSLLLNHLFRQITEYFTVFNIILKHDDIVSVLYLNHLNVLEYEVVKTKEEYIDDNLKLAYEASIEIFSRYHNVDYKKSQKLFSKPYGWAYKIIEDENGDYYNYISTSKVRNTVLKDYLCEEDLEVFNLYIKTADMAVHPTSTYLYQLNSIDEGGSGYREYLFDTTIRFYNGMLIMYKTFLRKNSTIEAVVDYAMSILRNTKFESISEFIQPIDDYRIINKYDKNKILYQDPSEMAKLILDSFDSKTVGLIPLVDTLHYRFYSLDKFQQKLYKEIDRLYAIIDTYFENVYSFYPKVLPKTAKLENIGQVLWITSFLMHEMATTYAFQSVQLFQKTYRLYIQYSAVLDKLMLSNEKMNKTFKDISYILLEDTIYSADYNRAKKEQFISEKSNQLSIPSEVVSNRINDFMGWTIYKKSNRSIGINKLSDLVSRYIKKIDPKTGLLQLIYKECNPVMHAGLYADEINNDLKWNKYGIIDYFAFSLSIVLKFCNDIDAFTTKYNDKKLNESSILMIGSITNILSQYSDWVLELKHKMRT